MKILTRRENKNRYLLSFFAALVQMDILQEVVVSFLLVGHTGNEGCLQNLVIFDIESITSGLLQIF